MNENPSIEDSGQPPWWLIDSDTVRGPILCVAAKAALPAAMLANPGLPTFCGPEIEELWSVLRPSAGTDAEDGGPGFSPRTAGQEAARTPKTDPPRCAGTHEAGPIDPGEVSSMEGRGPAAAEDSSHLLLQAVIHAKQIFQGWVVPGGAARFDGVRPVDLQELGEQCESARRWNEEARRSGGKVFGELSKKRK